MKYRADIDGLRAIAIVPIVLFHFGLGLTPGGFVGVDVFFVISGFLITSIIQREIGAGTFSLAHFYRRRALRILPALMVMIAACMVAAWVVMVPGEVVELGRTALASALFVSNVQLWMTSGYFMPDAKANPLLHTWSLGVEEQFYLVVPLLFLALRQLEPVRRLRIFAAIVVASLLASIILVAPAPSLTFYLLPTRFWEMGLGAWLALLGARGELHGRAAELGSWAGLAMIGASLLMLDASTPFPGLTAIPPTLGAALLLAAGPRGWPGRALSHVAPVAIGKISYSLYLWHWPVVVFYRLRFGPTMSWGAVALLAGLSVGLAVASYLVVERPFRSLPREIPSGRVLAGALAATVGCVLAAWTMQSAAGTWRTYPERVVDVSAYRQYAKTPEFEAATRANRCFIHSRTEGGVDAFDRGFCLGDGSGVLLVGDSHAAHLAGAFAEALDPTALHQATASGCQPVRGATGEERCTRLMQYVFEEWVPAHSPRHVIIAARWKASHIGHVPETVAWLRGQGVARVTVLGPTVEYHGALPSLLARDEMAGTDSVASFLNDDRRRLDVTMRTLLVDENVEYVSVYEAVCPDDRCQKWAGEVPMQFDHGHFTAEGARLVVARIVDRLEM